MEGLNKEVFANVDENTMKKIILYTFGPDEIKNNEEFVLGLKEDIERALPSLIHDKITKARPDSVIPPDQLTILSRRYIHKLIEGYKAKVGGVPEEEDIKETDIKEDVPKVPKKSASREKKSDKPVSDDSQKPESPESKEEGDKNKEESSSPEEGMRYLQEYAYDLMMDGYNVFLSGEAGTGKSYVIKRFIEDKLRKSRGTNIVVCAPTAIAAINVGGTTIHRAFGFRPKPFARSETPSVNPVMKSADVIIMDEVPMCRADLFDYMAKCIRKAEKITGKRKQLIVVGDFYQLPPVVTRDDKMYLKEVDGDEKGCGFAFSSTAWNEFGFKTVLLNDIVRQSDVQFIQALNRVRVGDSSGIKWISDNAAPEENDGIYICPTNNVAKEINEARYSEIDSKERVYIAKEENVSASDRMTEQELGLKVGAKVMFVANDPEGRYQNGSIGVVDKLGKEFVAVKLNGKIVNVSYYRWEIKTYVAKQKKGNTVLEQDVVGYFEQIPLKLAYAITIHKSQGQTFEKVNVFPECFEHGQLYVALSRATSINGMHLMSPILKKYLKTSPDVVDMYNSL